MMSRAALRVSGLRAGVVGYNHCGRLFRTCRSAHTRTDAHVVPLTHPCIRATDAAGVDVLTGDFVIFEDFISEAEHDALVAEVEPRLKKFKYDTAHFDKVITGYREYFHRAWSSDVCRAAMTRAESVFRDFAATAPIRSNSAAPTAPSIGMSANSGDSAYGAPSPSSVAANDGGVVMLPTHVLDLSPQGHILAHVDSVDSSGGVVAGLSLLSAAVLRLTREGSPAAVVDVLVKPRSFYMQRGVFRYDYAHAVLADSDSSFGGERIPRGRRISLMLRDALTKR